MNQYDLDSLEHESGLRPLGEYPSHCQRCRLDAERKAKRASCQHLDVETFEHASFGYGVYVCTAVCVDCGARIEPA